MNLHNNLLTETSKLPLDTYYTPFLYNYKKNWVCFSFSHQSSDISNQFWINGLRRFGWFEIGFVLRFFSPQIVQIVTDINITTEDTGGVVILSGVEGSVEIWIFE
ncbi:MAG: hypothetical protein ACYSOW_02050 [Planctomycetota bacterium]|jgi:hypothetical protein